MKKILLFIIVSIVSIQCFAQKQRFVTNKNWYVGLETGFHDDFYFHNNVFFSSLTFASVTEKIVFDRILNDAFVRKSVRFEGIVLEFWISVWLFVLEKN